MVKKCIDFYSKSPIIGNEKKSHNLRQKVNQLFYKEKMSKSEIARRLYVSRDFVTKWTRSPNMDFKRDNRGWTKGKRRRWDTATEEKIQEIHNDLSSRPDEFFSGATAVRQKWIKKYPCDPAPPLRTIGQIMKELDLSRSYKKSSGKGAARYLCYPEYSVHHIMGSRVLELDFIGKKFLQNRTRPINFIGFSFKKSPRLRHFQRISGETGAEIISHSERFFEAFEKPDAIKMDNGFAMAGSAPQPGVLSKVPVWLLSQKVVPIYAVPRKPFTQASIEGNNSVFSRNFWKARHFETLQQVDQQLTLFNKSSASYCEYQKPKIENVSKNFKPVVYFIRQVREENRKGIVNLPYKNFKLSSDFINYFVFVKWDLIAEQVSIFLEVKNIATLIETYPYRLNPKTQVILKRNAVI